MAEKTLKKEHLRAVKDQLRKLADLQPELDRMHSCGMDCADLEQARQEVTAKLNAIWEQWFPGQSA